MTYPEVSDTLVYLLMVALLGYGLQMAILRPQKAVIPWKKDDAG